MLVVLVLVPHGNLTPGPWLLADGGRRKKDLSNLCRMWL